jgi:pyruvate dehydrogenase E1 component
MYLDEFKHQLPDIDTAETDDWIHSLDDVVDQEGETRARFLLFKLLKRARQRQVGLPPLTNTRYINTISPEQEPNFPGNEELERRIRRLIRWNAVAMVLRANTRFAGLGGHLATYASAATLYEVGFNWFFKGRDGDQPGDQIFYQGHAAPGIYARAFLEGRLTEDQLDHFRRETPPQHGLSSYPHPRLMPDFWEFPTVSMGLGPVSAICQARPPGYEQLARLGLPGRRRDGRARGTRCAARRGARGPRQPDVRRQLQPPASRWPGSRQRQDHPGARGGVPRRRLERHQGRLGPRVG